jgi:DNA-nicking Smr family endonuclease
MTRRGGPSRHDVPTRATALADLGGLKKAIEQTARDAAAREVAARAAQAQARRDHELFARSIGAVTPLVHRSRADLRAPPPPAEPLQRLRDEAAALRASVSDDFDVESLLETDAALSFRRPGIGPDVVKKLRRGAWAIQAQIDLHGLRSDDAREQLAVFLRDVRKRGLRCVRVVHGKGNGSPGKAPVLKPKVQSWLVQKESVLAFTQARAAEGGAGALVVLLRPTPGER